MTTLSLISGQKQSRATAKGKSNCRGRKEIIKANDEYFAMPDRSVRGKYTPAPKRYCGKCFAKILYKTQKDLDECKKYIGG